MALDHVPLDRITETELQQLVDNKVGESRYIEYKRDPIGPKADDKKEFLKDVTAFANASGGHIVLGIEDKSGIPSNLVGVAVSSMDAEIQRLENIIRDSVEPRLVGVQIRQVPKAGGNSAIVIRIPRSWNPPHRVTFERINRFYIRNSNGSHEMSVQELRSQFLSAATLTERIDQFRQRRIEALMAGKGVRLAEPRGTLAVHVIPVTSLLDESAVDVQLAIQMYQQFRPLSSRNVNYGGTGWRHNFDGVLFWSGSDKKGVPAYTQVYRNGTIESVCCGCMYGENESGVPNRLIISGVEAYTISELPGFCKGLADLQITPPVVVLITLVNVHKSVITLPNGFDSSAPIEEPNLPLPAVTLDSLELSGNWQQKLKPSLDVMWNAYGRSGSKNFQPDGTWVPPRN